MPRYRITPLLFATAAEAIVVHGVIAPAWQALIGVDAVLALALACLLWRGEIGRGQQRGMSWIRR